MDAEKFDDLIRRFCTTRLTRVSALRGLFAGAAAAVTGGGLADLDAEAKAKKKGKSNKKGKGKKGKHKKNHRQVRTSDATDYGCSADKVALCHNSTAPNGGSIICPDASSADLQGHCNHTGPGNPTDCFCKNGGFTPHAECDQLQECGLCVKGESCFLVPPCVPKTCDDLGICGEHLSDGCDGFIDCDCPTDCPDDTNLGPNTECVNGECVCEPDTCPTGGTVGDPCGTFDDGCCGEFECQCTTDCPGGGANNTCDNGTCACTADTCPTAGNVGDPCGTFDDGCCGEFECQCTTDCPGGGANNTCDNGICACVKTPRDVACEGHCGETVDDGCCGTYECDACPCNSCTLGFYRQNGCRPGSATPCAAGSSLCKKCANYLASGTSSGPCTLDIDKALTATGKDVICAQAAAAFLNQGLPCGNNCTTGLDICNATNEQLTFANEGNGGTETCPLNAHCNKTACAA